MKNSKDSITSLENQLEYLITLTVKKSFPVFKGNSLLFSLYTLHSEVWLCLLHSLLSDVYVYEYDSTNTSQFFTLRLNSSGSLSLNLHARCPRTSIIFMTLHWTCLNWICPYLSCVNGNRTGLATVNLFHHCLEEDKDHLLQFPGGVPLNVGTAQEDLC